MGRSRRRKKKWKSPTPGRDKKPRKIVAKYRKIKSKATTAAPTYDKYKCHYTVAKVALPEGVPGKLFGATGRTLNESHLNLHEIDVFISLADSAFDAVEDWFGDHRGWPMGDYHCWPIEVLEERAATAADWIRQGKRVMCACYGGHGRTGTLLGAILAVLGDDIPCETVWSSYCTKAIETKGQEMAVRYMAGEFDNDEEDYRKKLEVMYGTRDNPVGGFLGSGSTYTVGADPTAAEIDKWLKKDNTGLENWVDEDAAWEKAAQNGYYEELARKELEKDHSMYQQSLDIDGGYCEKQAEEDGRVAVVGGPYEDLEIPPELHAIDVSEWYDESSDATISVQPTMDVPFCWVGKDDGDWVVATFDNQLKQWYEIVDDKDSDKLTRGY